MNGTNGRTTYLTQDKVNETEKKGKKKPKADIEHAPSSFIVFCKLHIQYDCRASGTKQPNTSGSTFSLLKSIFYFSFCAPLSLALSLSLTHCSLEFQCQRAPVWRRTHPKWCCRLTQLLFRNFRIRQLQCRECVCIAATPSHSLSVARAAHNRCWWCCWANDLWKYQNSKSLVAFNKNCNWTCALIRIVLRFPEYFESPVFTFHFWLTVVQWGVSNRELLALVPLLILSDANMCVLPTELEIVMQWHLIHSKKAFGNVDYCYYRLHTTHGQMGTRRW